MKIPAHMHMRKDYEDAIQEAAKEIIEKGKGDIDDALFARIVMCRRVDILRKEKREEKVAKENAENSPLLYQDPSDTIVMAIDLDKLLSKREREVIKLRFFEGFTFREMSTILNKAPNTCKRMVDIALTKLRKAYNGSDV